MAETKKRGGVRPGAGRPKGSRSILDKGSVRALKALRLRVPESIAPELADLADEAFEAVVQVMRREVAGFGTQDVLRAAAMVREEICGPIEKRHVVEGPAGGAVRLEFIFNHSEAKKTERDGQSGPARDAVVNGASQLEAPSSPAESPALGPLARNGQPWR